MIRKIFKYLYLFLFIIFIISIFQKNKLPEKKDINPLLLNEPIQVNTDRDGFEFSYREKDYDVKPVADYELWGLVVSVNNINTWYNYYHDENTVNLKDVCVIWRENIVNESYLHPRTKYSSGEWTCYVEWWSREGEQKMNQLSNNHLLTADQKIQEIIKDIKIGDQIYLKGSLVDYAEVGTPWYRKTSISRTDSNQSSRSGGACEVFYVDEINILQKNQTMWNQTYNWSKRIFIFLLLTQLIIFIFSVSTQKSYFKK